jgi:hypothetical protein
MAIGPVQLVILGFNHPDFHGDITAELERLRVNDTIRVIDALAVYKDGNGDLEVEHLRDTTTDDADELGSTVGALIGLDEQRPVGPGPDGPDPLADEDAWDVLADIPNDCAAALVLLEHQWAVPLRDAVVRAGGFHISDGFFSPLYLVGIGLHTAEEAAGLVVLERTGAPVAS